MNAVATHAVPRRAWAALAWMLVGAVAWAEGAAPPNHQSTASPARPAVVVVLGAPGEDEYESLFRQWADRWRAAAEAGNAEWVLLAGDGQRDDRDRLRDWLADWAAAERAAPLWLVLIGHGAYDGHTARFNFRGPDATLEELAAWIEPIPDLVAVINCSSASAPLINAASGPQRVVVTATKSGHEQNFARFGGYLAEAIGDGAADLDKDGQTSLLEAYLTACRRVAEFYADAGRLATEHALLDDNGDALGTPASWFRGVRAARSPQAGAAVDGARAHQLHLVPSDREAQMPPELRRRRDELELAAAALREQRPQLGDDQYYRRLEELMLQLARLYEQDE
mgnify:CR=1 FL=1